MFDPAFQPGGACANSFTSYAAANGDNTDSTAQIFGCGGTLAGALGPQIRVNAVAPGWMEGEEPRRAGLSGWHGSRAVKLVRSAEKGQ